jgi:putative membrane protein
MRFSPVIAVAAILIAAPIPATGQAQAHGHTAQSTTAKLDDPAIVGIFDAANGWDIATGTLASTKGTRTEVQDFGKMLANVHAAVQQQARDLAKKLSVTPTPVAKDFALAVNHENAMKKLNGLSGAAFDQAFLEHEVAYHKAVLDAVTTTFLPAIQNAELKKFVSDLGPAFQAHMVQAQELLKKK